MYSKNSVPLFHIYRRERQWVGGTGIFPPTDCCHCAELRRLAQEIKAYFEANPEAKEVLIFKGKREMSVTKGMINSGFIQAFMRIFYK